MAIKNTSKTPLIFFSTFPNKKSAAKFAQVAVKNKLAACVNILGSVKSVYFWKKKIHNENEVLIIGKTTSGAFKKLKTNMPEMHPYKVPELIAIKISDGLPDYLKWVKKNLS